MVVKKKILEKDVEAYLVKKIKALGGLCYKFRSPTQRGVADRICVLPWGDVWFLEIKRDGGKMTTLQQDHREQLLANFANHACLVGYEGVDAWLKNVAEHA